MKEAKMSENGPFAKLKKKQQKAIDQLFKPRPNYGRIAHDLNISESTLRRWRQDPDFISAFYERSIYKLGNSLPLAVSGLLDLAEHARSEMVRMQAIQTILKISGMFSDNSTPELDAARIRKANADARVAEAKAKAMEENGADVELLLDKMMDTLAKEDLKHGSK